MVQGRCREILEDVQQAECKLEHIYHTTKLAMDTIVRNPISDNPNCILVYHLLGVLCESMDNLRASLDDIGTAAVLATEQPT